MRIISVIVVENYNNTVFSIDNFAIYEEQLSQDIVNEAEHCFIETAVFQKFGDIGDGEDRNDFREYVADYIEDGWITIYNKTVNLTWSDV